MFVVEWHDYTTVRQFVPVLLGFAAIEENKSIQKVG